MHINLWEKIEEEKKRIYTRNKCPICRKGKKNKKMMNHIMKNVREERYILPIVLSPYINTHPYLILASFGEWITCMRATKEIFC